MYLIKSGDTRRLCRLPITFANGLAVAKGFFEEVNLEKVSKPTCPSWKELTYLERYENY